MVNKKFRVFDLVSRKYDDQIYKAGEQFGHPSSVDWVAEQWTGLKDKNDKDIYEGDFVEFDCGWGRSKYRGLVYYASDYAAFLVGLKDNHNMSLHNISNIEIIGNLYTNPITIP
jgi:uncharacterized phage protein (TIGR01671 family)